MPTLTWTLWNLFLAIIPVATAYLLAAGVRRYTLSRQRVPLSAGDDKGNIDRYPQFQRRQRVPLWAWLPLAVVWFAFLPNSCYLLTEWRHFLFDPMFQALRDAAENNALYMVTVAKFGFFFLLYSLAGVLCFTLAIRPIERLLREMRLYVLPLGVLFFFLVSLGVYMGLIVRLNSWDIVQRPGFVFHIALHAFTTPVVLKMVVIFAFLLWILYENVDIWVDGAAQRLQLWFGRKNAATSRSKTAAAER